MSPWATMMCWCIFAKSAYPVRVRGRSKHRGRHCWIIKNMVEVKKCPSIVPGKKSLHGRSFPVPSLTFIDRIHIDPQPPLRQILKFWSFSMGSGKARFGCLVSSASYTVYPQKTHVGKMKHSVVWKQEKQHLLWTNKQIKQPMFNSNVQKK